MSTDPRAYSRLLINGKGYPFDHNGFARTPVARRDLIDQAVELSERSLDDPAAWRRGQRDFRDGMNQRTFDREDSSRERFSSCWGMRPTPEGLLVTPRMKMAAADRGGGMVYGGGYGGTKYLYTWNGGQIYYSSDTPSYTVWSTVTMGSITAVYDVAFAFDKIVLSGLAGGLTDVFETPIGSTATPTQIGAGYVGGAGDADMLAYTNGRLFTAESTSNEVREIASDGTTTLVWDSGLAIADMSPAPGGLYIAANSGRSGGVWISVVSPVDGSYSDPVMAVELPDDEYVTAIEFATGVLIIGTNYGVRLGVPDANGFLTYGPLNQPERDGRTLQGSVISLSTWRDRVLFVLTPADFETALGDDYPVASPSWIGWVGAMTLRRFVDTLEPATWLEYAFELDAGDTGTPTLVGVAHAGDVPVVSTSGDELYVDALLAGDANPFSDEPSAMATGIIDYGTVEPKQWSMLTANVRVTTLSTAGWSVGGRYRIDGGTWAALATTVITAPATFNVEVEWDLTTAAAGREIEIEFTFIADTGSPPAAADTLTLSSWQLRSVPVPFVGERIRVPVKLYDAVDLDGLQLEIEPYDYWLELHTLMQSKAHVDFTMGDRTEKVYVEAVSVLPDQETQQPLGWDGTQAWLQSTWLIDLVTVKSV